MSAQESAQSVETAQPRRVAYRWTGVNRRGVAESGTLESARGPVAFTERRLQQGWRSLTVTLDGVEVARIEKVAGRRRVVAPPGQPTSGGSA